MAAVASPPTMAGESDPNIMKDDTTQLPQLPDASHRVLTPPTSEDNDKHDGNSSELSDLEDDDDDIGDIYPDHYWDEENGGKIPVFKPVRMHTLFIVPKVATSLHRRLQQPEAVVRTARITLIFVALLYRLWINFEALKSSSRRLTTTE